MCIKLEMCTYEAFGKNAITHKTPSPTLVVSGKGLWDGSNEKCMENRMTLARWSDCPCVFGVSEVQGDLIIF